MIFERLKAFLDRLVLGQENGLRDRQNEGDYSRARATDKARRRQISAQCHGLSIGIRRILLENNAKMAFREISVEVRPRLFHIKRNRPMGAQWKQAGREANAQKRGQVVVKLVREIMVAAKLGGPEPDLNARLAAAVEKARKGSVTRDTIERAIKKGAGLTDEKVVY